MRPNTMLGWHFLAADRRLLYGDRAVVTVGGVYTATGPLALCRNGLHASRRAVDALQYAPGPIVCRVRLDGELLHDTDKSVARSRTVLWMADVTAPLHEFALVCAEQALGLAASQGSPPDARSLAALATKRRWLRGEATDTELDAARAAAWAAARAAADAAWAAAWDAQNTVLEALLGDNVRHPRAQRGTR